MTLAMDLPASGRVASVTGLLSKLAAMADVLGEVEVADKCGLKVRMLRLALTRQNRFGPKPLGTIARNMPRLREDVVQYLIDEWADSAPSDEDLAAA